MKSLWLAALLATLAVPAFAQSDEKVGKLPSDAEIIFSSAMAHEPDVTGVGIKGKGGDAEELYVSTVDGKDITRITFSRYTYNKFEVSPDRTMIVTARFEKGDTLHFGRLFDSDFKQLVIIDLVHGTVRHLWDGHDAGIGGVAWSADSKYIYFAARSANGLDIYRMAASGEDQPEILTANLNELLGEPGTLKFVADTAVSPDGAWLAMLYVNAATPKDARKTLIVLFKLDGSQARILTDGGNLQGTPTNPWNSKGDYNPEISPGNKYVAFERAMNTSWTDSDLFRVDWDGSNLIDISKPAGETRQTVDGHPSWSDSCKIIYTVWSSTGSYPEYADLDGTRHRVNLPGDGQNAKWIRGAGGPKSNAC